MWRRLIKALTGRVLTALKAATREYQTISSTISAELGKLIAASRDLERHSAQLVAQQRSGDVWWQGTAVLVLFSRGGLCGMMVEKRELTGGPLHGTAVIWSLKRKALANQRLGWDAGPVLTQAMVERK